MPYCQICIRNTGYLFSVLFIFLASISNPVSAEMTGNGSRFVFESPHMGTLFRITIYSDDFERAREAADSSFQRVEVLNTIFSDYLPDSEVQLLSNTSGSDQYIPVSKELYDILSIAQEVSQLTGGAFDVTAGPFTHTWRDVIRQSRSDLPCQNEISVLSSSVGYELISFHETDQAIRLEAPDMQIDLGGIGKGYAATELWKVLQHFGMNQVLINAGGDILPGDPPPGRDNWILVLPENPEIDNQTPISIKLANKAITTSGDLYQFVEIDGVRYSHIVDPETGLGVTNQNSATVIGKDATLTDALATALTVLPHEDGIAIINQLDGFEARIHMLTEDGSQFMYSDGFNTFLFTPGN